MTKKKKKSLEIPPPELATVKHFTVLSSSLDVSMSLCKRVIYFL